MNNNYKINDILTAIDALLDDKNSMRKELRNKSIEPLKLTNEVNNFKSNLENISKDTEKIILDAEKYLKK